MSACIETPNFGARARRLSKSVSQLVTPTSAGPACTLVFLARAGWSTPGTPQPEGSRAHSASIAAYLGQPEAAWGGPGVAGRWWSVAVWASGVAGAHTLTGGLGQPAWGVLGQPGAVSGVWGWPGAAWGGLGRVWAAWATRVHSGQATVQKCAIFDT